MNGRGFDHKPPRGPKDDIRPRLHCGDNDRA